MRPDVTNHAIKNGTAGTPEQRAANVARNPSRPVYKGDAEHYATRLASHLAAAREASAAGDADEAEVCRRCAEFAFADLQRAWHGH